MGARPRPEQYPKVYPGSGLGNRSGQFTRYRAYSMVRGSAPLHEPGAPLSIRATASLHEPGAPLSIRATASLHEPRSPFVHPGYRFAA
jgi:hypothetical protein